MPKLAANLSWLFTEKPFLDRFAAAAKAGFDAVEMAFPYDQTQEAIALAAESARQSVVLLNLPPGAEGERGIAGLPGREAEFAASVELGLRYAAALGTPRLHALAGVVPSGPTRRAAAHAMWTISASPRAASPTKGGRS